MLSLVKKRHLAKIKDKIKTSRTSSRSFARTTIRRAIMSPIALNLLRQKNSCSFGDLHIDDCKYGGLCQDPGGSEAYALYLVFSPISVKPTD